MSLRKHHRRSIRLPGYDYAQPGAYYVTLNTKNREYLFGSIENGIMHLSQLGKIAEQFWKAIPKHYPNVSLDEFIIMPDHMHGIIVINYVGVQNFEPRRHRYQHTLPKSVGSIVRAYKASVTQWSKKHGMFHGIWQRNYYEHVIRNYEEWEILRSYIKQNPENWKLDRMKSYSDLFH